ncbi:39185_t:CDS:2 [Gigaspora margarita]|uniref:39185_t:CDS:1 n=1 Tax=Gigaspora margarita TaxID=4874 RepID=A0ABN7XH32_GIGMA|nr:39185_t:CDS:2 [Gigaspora margarita]
MYRKTYAIFAPCETRWKSLFFMCTTLLRTQEALEILAIKFKSPFSETRRRTGDNYIHRKIFEIIGSNDFWDQIKNLVKLLTPYCKLLNMLQ